MISSAMEWLAAQPPNVSTFMGTLLGSSLGLVALLIGALVNASINRARDNRLRDEEARSIRSALLGELTGLEIYCNRIADNLETGTDATPHQLSSVLIPDIAKSVRVVTALLPRFGLLPPEQIRIVIEAYGTVDQMRPALLLQGMPHANGMHISVPEKYSSQVASMARSTAKTIGEAIAALRQPGAKSRS